MQSEESSDKLQLCYHTMYKLSVLSAAAPAAGDVQAGTWRLIYSSGFNGGSLGGSRWDPTVQLWTANDGWKIACQHAAYCACVTDTCSSPTRLLVHLCSKPQCSMPFAPGTPCAWHMPLCSACSQKMFCTMHCTLACLMPAGAIRRLLINLLHTSPHTACPAGLALPLLLCPPSWARCTKSSTHRR